MSDDPVVRLSGKPAGKPGEGGKPKPRGLGRGLGALMGDTRREEPLTTQSADKAVSATGTTVSGFAMLAIAEIDAHPNQPRSHFDDNALDELAASIAQRGVIQPVIVRPARKGRYQLVAGERRWRAAQRARIHEIPAIVRELEERDVIALALIENLQREDLNPIEEARAYHRLAEDEGLTQAEIAEMVDKSRSHVANLQRLLALPDAVIALVENGELSMGHARALIGVDDAEDIARQAISKELSVREVEKLVRRRAGAGSGRKPRKAVNDEQSADIAAVQSNLEQFLGMPVRIVTDKDLRSGEMTIRYASLDQLDLLCQRLTGGTV